MQSNIIEINVQVQKHLKKQFNPKSRDKYKLVKNQI